MGAEEEKQRVMIVNTQAILDAIGDLPTAAAIAALQADVTTLLGRLSSDRAGYLDNLTELAGVNVPADLDTLLTRLTAQRATNLDELGAANIPADVDGLTGYLQRNRPSMVFKSAPSGIVTLPAVAGDVNFPSVTVALPSGATVARAEYALLGGKLEDTSGSENAVDQAGKAIYGKLSTESWGGTDILALTFANGGLEAQAGPDVYSPMEPLFGAIDISSIVSASGTYNFRSDQSEHSAGVTVTGASLKIHGPVSIVMVWFN